MSADGDHQHHAGHPETDSQPEAGGHDFDREYWRRQWRPDSPGAAMAVAPPHPCVQTETAGLTPGTALDAGCGAGAESILLAENGWRVTGVDISAEALAHARRRAEAAGTGESVDWVEADLTSWEPQDHYDLVLSCYAHPAMPQLDFYARLSGWVRAGGTLLIVGHLTGSGHGETHEDHDGPGHAQPPREATTLAADIAGLLDERWSIVTAAHRPRTLTLPGDRIARLEDVIVRATRIA
ncbi:class I SAM-dependent methyltransferase [Sediminivirga luteola]|uniref:Methyltransferase domain-containing protein n=1 Tax=Sediminivirga luteola TaxID=1774748 RepID=A0A8J2XLB0_9MICO|nr:class I SAM-dependent methyltransferase [Sediminivirga luteola]GGA20566.1 hypothetical protein GCM10011333_24560 [Sediminivirga luteola]